MNWRKRLKSQARQRRAFNNINKASDKQAKQNAKQYPIKLKHYDKIHNTKQGMIKKKNNPFRLKNEDKWQAQNYRIKQ